MNITRHNYEEFFILYLDNELSREECGQVELFVQAHPDLAEELAMLQQAKLIPDNELVYDNKESLLMIPGQPFIDLTNYEEWLLLYVDNELNTEERKVVEKFVSLNPAAAQELELLQQAKLQPEQVVYFNKESLYRKEEKERRVIPIRWWRLAAAAILLVVAGASVFLALNKPAGPKPGVAGTNSKKTNQAVPVITPVIENKPAVETAITNHIDNPVAVIPKENTATQSQEIKENKTVAPKKQSTIEDQAIADVTNNNPNNLPAFRNRKDINDDGNNSLIAAADTRSLTNHNEIRPSFTVTLPVSQPYNDVDDQPEKRSKLRGLLRKVTRTFEKTTNIKATDENDRLLVAGLAIQL